MDRSIRWGILSTGNIAKKFVEGLSSLSKAEIVAVGSRTVGAANSFANQFNISKRHGSYSDLANDPEVDVIYIATPHPLHCANTLLCLNAGKAVLCEKPFAINRQESERMVSLARGKGLFLMEAMWTRFLPIMRQVREWIGGQAIGEAKMVTADFGIRSNINPEGRLFNLNLGGGGLLDLGIYTISFASMVFGSSVSEIFGHADIGQTGVDEQAGVMLGYPDGQIALLSFALRTRTPHGATIFGTDGSICIHPPFWHPTAATLTTKGKSETVEKPYVGNGYNYEADEVMHCLWEGKNESDILPLKETLSIMDILDQLRRQWGLKYPME